MGLADGQKLLARLSTDAPFRQRCFDDPAGTGSTFGLGPEETTRLIREIERFAVSLLHKRRGDVEKLLPLTRRALGDQRFTALFLSFARGFAPSGTRKPRADALAFTENLRHSSAIVPCWLRDLVGYERAQLTATDPNRRIVIRTFRHSIVDLAQAALEQGPPPPRRFVVAIWLRLSARGRLRHVLFSFPAGRA